MITRFAPSPTGPLHLGHAFSALTAYDMARAANGTFLLRIEDIDQSRARLEWEQQIYDDLSWLGITWPEPVLRQSTRLQTYRDALETLWAQDLLYPCTCTRRDIAAAASAPQEGAPMIGPDGITYPGTCRPDGTRQLSTNAPQTALRLNMRRALANLPDPLTWNEETPQSATHHHMIHRVGDIVLARRDMGTSYHLAVVVDDAFQNVTHVTRGADLTEATPIHILLQHLLNLPQPHYHHHRLIRDDAGKRLAKRDDARALSRYRNEGKTPHDIRKMLGT